MWVWGATDGTMWAWGGGSFSSYQVGAGDTWESATVTCSTMLAVRSDHTLWAAGSNPFGQLGVRAALGLGRDSSQATALGPVTSQLVCTRIGSLAGWTDVVRGGGRTYALRPQWPRPHA